MADDESTEIPSPAEQPAEVKPAEPKKPPEEQKAELKSQIKGLVTLLVVFGLLWGLVKVMPTLGEKLGAGFSSLSSNGDEKAEAETSLKTDVDALKEATAVESAPTVAKLKAEVETSVEPTPVTVVEAPPAKDPATADEPIQDDKVKAQILEAIRRRGTWGSPSRRVQR